MQEIYFWKKAPFIRLLFSLIAGILVQWFCQLVPVVWYAMFAGALLILISFFYFPLFTRYRLGFLNGVATLLPFIAIGALLVWHHDIRNTKNWIGNHIKGNISYIATLEETPVEKTKSFKADASITHLVENEKVIPVKGKIILYFKKDSLRLSLAYGSQIIFKKPLQEIKNSGNPGGFDYKRYSLFHGITHQVYLASEEFIALLETNQKWVPAFLNTVREKVLNILRNNIQGDKETGLAEALLIGYKGYLDKTLVQSLPSRVCTWD